MTFAACNNALEGIHPTFKHTPPSTGQRSIKVTFMPRSAARNAAVYPPTPAPSTTKSAAPSGAALTGFEADLDPGLEEAALVVGGVATGDAGLAAGGAVGEEAAAFDGDVAGAGAVSRAGVEAEAEAGAALGILAGAAASDSTIAIRVPDDTASPFLISTEWITPLTGEGTSIAALSDSSEINGSSTATLSPFLTRTSRTVTPLTSPRSGTRTSTVLIAMPSCHRAFLTGTPRSEPLRRHRSRDDHRIGTAAASAAAQRRRARRPVFESTGRPRGWRLPAR